jgi:hypothetical protein
MATTYTPKTKTAGTPLSANTGAITRVVQIPPGKTPPEIVAGGWRVE